MQGQFSCVCQADGSMRCSSLSLPCIINDRGYEIGEKFKLYNYMDKHMDYEVRNLSFFKPSQNLVRMFGHTQRLGRLQRDQLRLLGRSHAEQIPVK